MTTEVVSAILEDLLRRPRDGTRYDVVGGELISMPPAWPGSSRVAFRLSVLLGTFIDAHALDLEGFGSDAGFLLPTGDLVSPDASLIRRSKLPNDQPTGFWSVVPDLAIEVVSPSDTWPDVWAKVDAYRRAGVPLVWVLDPRTRAATMHTADGHARTLRSADGGVLEDADLLPGFQLPLDEIFGT